MRRDDPAIPFDAVVVGGGIAGLSAALQLARARRHVLVVDSGLPRNRFAHASHGLIGHDGKSPAEILDGARAQLLRYPTAEISLAEAVEARRRDDRDDRDDVEITLAAGDVLNARRLVLAVGVVDELPDVPGLRERWGATVLHCPYCHGYEVAGGRLGVLAIGAHSIHQALLLGDWSDDVVLFTNGAIVPEAADRAALARRRVRVETAAVAALEGETGRLRGVRLADGRGVPVDALFTAPRTRPASVLAERLGCALDEGPLGPFVRTDDRKETTVPGVFAAGDAARPTHNATWAAADGVTAGIAAHQSLVLR